MAATEPAAPGVDLSQVVKIPTPLPWSDEFKINVYLIEARPLTLIDCGIRGTEPIATIERAFAERGRRIEDIEQIVITHAHFDHYGSGAELVRRSGARVFAHPIERVHMEHFPSGSNAYKDTAEHYFRLWGVPEEMIEAFFRREELMPMLREDMAVDVSVEDGDRVKIEGFALEAIHVPGHCQGHLCYLNRARGILFSGDHLLPNISPVPLLALGTDPTVEKPKSLIQFLASLEKIERFPARIALPSHGPNIPDIPGLLHGYRLHCEKRQRKMHKILAPAPLTPFEAAKAYFPHKFDSELYLVLSEAVGHLELMEARGRAERFMDGAVVRFRALEEPAP